MRKGSLGFRHAVDNPNASIDSIDSAVGFYRCTFADHTPYHLIDEYRNSHETYGDLMIANYTFFACGGGGGVALLVMAMLALWIVFGVLFLANLCLVFELRDGPLLRHGASLLLYATASLAGYNHLNSGSGSNVEFVLLALACGLPAVVIGHFIWLIRLVRRERRALRAERQLS